MIPRLRSRRSNLRAIPIVLLTRYIFLQAARHGVTSSYFADIDFSSLRLHRTTTAASTALVDGQVPLILDADGAPHPIPVIVTDARRRHRARLSQRSTSLEQALAAYRQRRQRHPPPGFDKWVQHALDTDAVLIESFWDRIYHDLAPFWALDPSEMSRRADGWEHVILVRKGKASFIGNVEGRVPWMQLWTSLVDQVASHLPDMDIPINMMDEPRLLVQWERISELVEEERRKRRFTPKSQARTKFSKNVAFKLNKDDDDLDSVYTGTAKGRFKTKWYDKLTPYWELLRLACPPSSPARSALAINDFSTPTLVPPDYAPGYTFAGYVVNFTASADPCTQPHLRGMHGSLVLPISLSTSQDLLPIFGGSKLQANNEILLPGAMYLSSDRAYSDGNYHGPRWAKKKDSLVWRGDATGGQNTPENWAHFHRHRLVQMLNGTVVSAIEAEAQTNPAAMAQTFALPPQDTYPSARRRNGTLGAWLSGFADAGFVHRLCEDCSHVDPYLPTVPGLEMTEQFQHKFLVDADGNSFSARFRSFLQSTSLPLKATIYAEWHDDRLAPWVHFVPLDNSFRDLYAVLEFFADADATKADAKTDADAKADADRPRLADELARQIAEEGKAWAEKVLRHEDMALYVWRLLLEWARLCDERRELLAYVDDL